MEPQRVFTQGLSNRDRVRMPTQAAWLHIVGSYSLMYAALLIEYYAFIKNGNRGRVAHVERRLWSVGEKTRYRTVL